MGHILSDFLGKLPQLFRLSFLMGVYLDIC